METSESPGGGPQDTIGVVGAERGADGDGSLASKSLAASMVERVKPMKGSSSCWGSLSNDWSNGDGDTRDGQPR